MNDLLLAPLHFGGEEWMVISYAAPRNGALAELSASETYVIDRWLEGASMRAIAAQRSVAVRTVANQIASAYAKLGVSSRDELLELLHEHEGR